MRKKEAKAKREGATMERLAARQGMAADAAGETPQTRRFAKPKRQEGGIKKYPPLAQMVLVDRAKAIADGLEAYLDICTNEAIARIEYLDKVRHDGTESEVEDAERIMVRRCYALGSGMLCLDRLAEKEPLAFVAGSALLLSRYDQDICRSVAEDQAFAFIRMKRDMAIDSCEESLDELVAIQEEVARLCAEKPPTRRGRGMAADAAGGMAADAAGRMADEAAIGQTKKQKKGGAE